MHKDEFGYDREKVVPIRYINNGALLGNCNNDMEITFGEVLLGGSVMRYQESCSPNTGNAGNFYNWQSSTAGGQINDGNTAFNSICPKNWHVPHTLDSSKRSYINLIDNTLNAVTMKENLGSLPLSFTLSGGYSSAYNRFIFRGQAGFYLTSTKYTTYSVHYMTFKPGDIKIKANNYNWGNARTDYSNQNYSLRCVADVIYLFLLL